jgi:hypothetical protein
MKKLLIGIGLIAAAGLLWNGIPSEEAIAVSGCCKQRVGAKWRRIDDNFEQCKRRNDNRDQGDDIFAPVGEIWWDVGC